MRTTAHIRQLKPSATLAINERSQQLIDAGKKVYRLGFGQSPFPVPEEVVKALQANAHRKDYLPVKGLGALREAVAAFNERTIGVPVEANQVLIGPGSKELIYDLLLATDATILLPSPTWVSYEPQAILAQKPVCRVETKASERWLLTPAALEAACQQIAGDKILILTYPGNPTGTSFSPEQLAALAEVARKYQLLVVADEIYGEVHHTGRHTSIANWYPEGTIISAGLSKWCGAGGWRLGTFSFPKKLIQLLDLMATIASETFTSVSSPIQYAAVTAFQGSPAIKTYVKNSRKILNAIGVFIHSRLTAMKLEMPAADGGFYLFPDFEYYRKSLNELGVQTNTDLCEFLLNKSGVAILPGTAFGRPETELTARLSFVDFDGAKLLDILMENPQLVIDDSFMDKYCPSLTAAMDALQELLTTVTKQPVSLTNL